MKMILQSFTPIFFFLIFISSGKIKTYTKSQNIEKKYYRLYGHLRCSILDTYLKKVVEEYYQAGIFYLTQWSRYLISIMFRIYKKIIKKKKKKHQNNIKETYNKKQQSH